MSKIKVGQKSVNLFFSIFFLLFFAGCASIQNQPTASKIEAIEPTLTPLLPSDVIVVENAEEICFENCEKCSLLEATFTPAGCYSSECTRDVSHYGKVDVDEDSFTIQFFTRYEAADLIGPPPEDNERNARTCSADCNYKDRTRFWIGPVPQGTYSIWLGDEHLGDLTVPTNIPGLEPVCFENASPY